MKSHAVQDFCHPGEIQQTEHRLLLNFNRIYFCADGVMFEINFL